MTNVKSLLEMYVKMGGSLTDTYSDIAGGVPVGQYSTISDAILACSKKYSAGGGGGAEKFIVTLTQDAQTEEWTADKTVAEIVAADKANQVVVAKYPRDGLIVDIPLNMAMEFQGMFGAVFVGLISSGNDNKVAAVHCMNEGSGDVIATTEQPIPTSTNAPLIVTLTAGSTEGQFVGNKTFSEIHEAKASGRVVVLSDSANAALDVIGSVSASEGYAAFYINTVGQSATATGQGSDYITVNAG